MKTFLKNLDNFFDKRLYKILIFGLFIIFYLPLRPALSDFYLSFFFYSIECKQFHYRLIAEQILSLKAAIYLLLSMTVLYGILSNSLNFKKDKNLKIIICLIHSCTLFYSAYYFSIKSDTIAQIIDYIPILLITYLFYLFKVDSLYTRQKQQIHLKKLGFFFLILVGITITINFIIFSDRSYLYADNNYTVTIGSTQYVTDQKNILNQLIKVHSLLPNKLVNAKLRVVIRAMKNDNQLLKIIGLKDIDSKKKSWLGYYSSEHRSVFLNNKALQFLNTQKLRALIAHEMTHVYQNKYSLEGPKWKKKGRAECVAYDEEYSDLNVLTMPTEITGTPFENCYATNPIEKRALLSYNYQSAYMQAWYYLSYLKIPEEDFFANSTNLAPWKEVLEAYSKHLNLLD